MKKIILSAGIALLLAGCATPGAQFGVVSHSTVKAVKAPVKAPVVVSTAPATFKKRWWNKFPKHPKWFHPK